MPLVCYIRRHHLTTEGQLNMEVPPLLNSNPIRFFDPFIMDTWDPLLTILQELDTTTAISIKSHSCAMMGYYQSASTQIYPDIKVDRPRPAIIV